MDQTCFTFNNRVSRTEEEENNAQHHNDLALSDRHLSVIKQLEKRVNVIPIIAKADEFTIAQTEAVKALLRSVCSDGAFMDPLTFARSSAAENESYDSIGRLAMLDSVDSENKEEAILMPIIRSRSNSIHRFPPKINKKRFSQIAIKPSPEEIDKILSNLTHLSWELRLTASTKGNEAVWSQWTAYSFSKEI